VATDIKKCPDMHMLEIPISIVLPCGEHVTLQGPTAPPSERVRGAFYERGLPAIAPVLLQVTASLPCIAEVAVLVAARYPSAFSSEVLSRLVLSGQLPTMQINRYFLAGSVLAIVGSLGRLWCFRTLGRHFTYELSLRKDHKLVTTGPYAIVRHPSYLTWALSVLGLSFVIGGPGSFVRQCGWLGTSPGMLFGSVWAVLSVLVWMVCVDRSRREDAFLREHFREEWERYAKRVRYRLIPGVL